MQELSCALPCSDYQIRPMQLGHKNFLGPCLTQTTRSDQWSLECKSYARALDRISSPFCCAWLVSHAIPFYFYPLSHFSSYLIAFICLSGNCMSCFASIHMNFIPILMAHLIVLVVLHPQTSNVQPCVTSKAQPAKRRHCAQNQTQMEMVYCLAQDCQTK